MSSGRLQEVKNNGKSSTVRPKKWSRPRSLTGGGRLLEVSTERLRLGKFWCFGLAVAYGKWSLTGGGRLLEVSTERLRLGKFWCFGLAVAYGKWSLTGGGRT